MPETREQQLDRLLKTAMQALAYCHREATNDENYVGIRVIHIEQTAKSTLADITRELLAPPASEATDGV